MNSFSEKYVSACCPHLASSEVACVYDHIHTTFKSLDLVHAEDVRTIARQLFPNAREERLPLSENMKKASRFRVEEGIANLKSAKFWLSKVSNPSDAVGMAIRDIGIIVDQLEGVKQ
tara:strand:+ start:128 stop:478 length:351 start_codon:yes stop_codon:yes gene_type:complete